MRAKITLLVENQEILTEQGELQLTAMSGSGTGDLMDEIVRDLPPETKNEEEAMPVA